MERHPLLTNRFSVLIDGVEVGICAISPLTSEAEPSAGDEPARNGRRSVVVRRALTGSSELYRWREQASAGRPAERTVLIRHYDATGEAPVSTWKLEGAWPRRWSGPALDASDNETIACEELELSYARLVWNDEDGGNERSGEP